MIFGLGKKKLKVTTEQLGEGLWIFCRQFTKMFYEQFKTGLEDDEIYKYAIDILKDQEFYVSTEIIIINLWIISKALESDKKSDKKSLGALHKIFLQEYKAMGRTDEEKDEMYKYATDILKDRLNRYSKTWDNNSGGNQSILSLEMLECMLNDGKTDKRLLDSYLFSLVNIHVLTMMKEVLDFYKNYEVIDS